MPAFRLFILATCISGLFPLSLATASPENKNVLYLNSYHHGYQWSDQLLEGIRSVVDESNYKVDLQIEYMDAKKYNYDYINSHLATLYGEKFRNEQFDVIIVSDNDALNFVLHYRSQLFAGIPIIFCGVNDIASVDLSSGNITGVVESFDLPATIAIARTLHPQVKNMVVVGDQSTAGRAIERQVHAMMHSHENDIQVEFWFQLPLKETLQRAQQLSDDTIFFFTPWYQTIEGKFYVAEEVMAAIYRHSTIPIYTAWDFLLGHGAVGGYMLSGIIHGRQAAEMALRVLQGESAEAIPVVHGAAGRYMFDYTVTQRLGIDRDLLPSDAVILNAPHAFYELPKELFWTIMISILLLCIALVLLGSNMIARRRVERKVIDQLAFQETLMDTIPQLVSWKQISGKYLGANRAFMEFFRIEHLDSIEGRSTRDVVYDSDYVQWSRSADVAVVNSRKAVRKIRKKIEFQDGELGWIEVNKVPLRDPQGKLFGILSTAENVTREQNLEKQLLQSQKLEAIGTLAGGIAHDFNNILTSIINSTELAIDDVPPGSQTEKDLQRVLKAARRGGQVVKRILSFSRPTMEQFQVVDVRTVINEVLMLLDASMPSSITVSAELGEKECFILGDPTQLHQVILNLCTNAFQALSPSGGSLQLLLEQIELVGPHAGELGLDPGNYAVLRVKDNGPGIAQDVVDKIFDPFFTTKDIGEGTGLGLAVVHGIISGHRGVIRVESKKGRGTEFTLYFPVTEKRQLSAPTEKTALPTEDATVLFVEDDMDQLDSTPRILQDMGYRVIAVQRPSEALATANSETTTIDVVLTDYDMPECSGVELANKLFPLPVILVSGREEAAAAAAGIPNIIEVVRKPYDRQKLEQAFSALAARRQ